MANLRETVQKLYESTSSKDVKNVCESYLQSKEDANLEDSLFTGLKKLVTHDMSIAKLLLEKESYTQTKADIETQISKDAAKRFAENWDKTRRGPVANVGTSNTHKQENANNAAKNEKLLEGLQSITDKTAQKYVSDAKKDLYGVRDVLESLSKSPIANHPNLKYVIARFENALEEGVAEYAIVRDLLSSITPFKWDATVRESFELLNKRVNERAVDIEVQNTIQAIKSTDTKRFYTTLVDKMNEWVYSDNKNIHDLAREVKGYMFNPLVRDLTNKLLLMENSKGTTFNVPVKSNNCRVEKIYSPVLETDGGMVFNLTGSFFLSKEGVLSRLTLEQVNALPKTYLALCETFTDGTAKVVNDQVTVYMGKTKIQMTDDKRVFINEKQVEPANLGSQLLFHTQVNIFAKTSDIINKVVNVYESLDNICEIDFGKSIVSNLFEATQINLFKKDGLIYVNKISGAMNENSFITANATQTVKLVKEFLSFDVSESLAEFLEGDYQKRVSMDKEAKDILGNITIIEGELNKIEGAILQDPAFGDMKEIQEAKALLEKELNKLQSSWQKVNENIKNFETLLLEDEEEEEEDGETIVVTKEPEATAPEETPAATDAVPAPTAADSIPAPVAAAPEVAPAATANADIAGQGVAGAEGAQTQAEQIPGNDHQGVVADTGTGNQQMVAAGFSGAEGDQNKTPDQQAEATEIKKEFQAVPVVTPGPENGKVIPGEAAPKSIPVSASNAPAPDIAAAVASKELPTVTPEVDKDGGVKESKDEVEAEGDDKIGIDAKVTVVSRNENGVVTGVSDGKYQVTLDNGENVEVEQGDLRNLEASIEKTVTKNEADFKNESKKPKEKTEEKIEGGSEEDEAGKKDEGSMYVKATLTIDLGPFKQGDSVDIDATMYTAGGDDDPVKLREPKEGVTEVPKKYLKLSDEATSKNPAAEVGSIAAKTSNAIEAVKALETLVVSNDKINAAEIQDALAKLQKFSDAINKEQEVSAPEADKK